MRVDKWLWAARFYKTRSLAARACELGRVACCGQQVKASREVRVGDRLQVKNETGNFEFEVLQLSNIRGPASVAQTLYLETDASRDLRLKWAKERDTMSRIDLLGEGRPSKRNRREFDKLRGRV